MCNCSKKSYDARSAILALARAASLREMGDPRAERRFYACPAAGDGTFHLTSVAATIGDKSPYTVLSQRICANPESVLRAS